MSSDRTRKAILAAYQRDEANATIDGLARAAGVTVSSVYYHLTRLRKEGLVTRARIPLTAKGTKWVKPPKLSHEQVCRKRSAAARQTGKKATARGENAAIMERIEQIVAAAKQSSQSAEAGVDVVYDFRRALSARVRATKLG